MLHRLTRISVILIAVIAVASVAFAASAAAGKGKSTTTISIKAQARLVSSPTQGPGADVTVTYTCFPGFGGGYYANFGNVSLGDIHGVQGFASFSARCNDRSHTSIVFVPGPFRAGAAAANAFICGFDCNSTSREIKLA